MTEAVPAGAPVVVSCAAAYPARPSETTAMSTDDAGSGPTKGAKPNTDSSADINSNGSKENSAGVTAGPELTGGSQPVTPAMPEKK